MKRETVNLATPRGREIARAVLGTNKRDVFFFSFKGDGEDSTLDQITLPPTMGFGVNVMYHCFGEWLKREGHGWELLEDERLCRLAVEYFNRCLTGADKPRRFDRMAMTLDGVPITHQKRI